MIFIFNYLLLLFFQTVQSQNILLVDNFSNYTNYHLCHNYDLNNYDLHNYFNNFNQSINIRTGVKFYNQNLIINNMTEYCFWDNFVFKNNDIIYYNNFKCSCYNRTVSCNKTNDFLIKKSSSINNFIDYDKDLICINNYGNIPNCKTSIQKYNREICVECDNGYYLDINNPKKCLSYNLLSSYCKNKTFLIKDNIVSCIPCKGEIYNNNCMCSSEYIGKQCNFKKDSVYCNSKGKYDDNLGICLCKKYYYGKHCQYNKKKHCQNGIYDDNNDKCVCYHNYYGDYCQNINKCFYGDYIIKNKTCECIKGFYGKDCNSITPRNNVIKDKIQYNCLYGFGNNCECISGYFGDKCQFNKCNNGIYNNTKCLCDYGYSGKYCDTNNLKICNYNGIYQNKHCECFDKWFGNYCQFINGTYFKLEYKTKDIIEIIYPISNILPIMIISNISKFIKLHDYNITLNITIKSNSSQNTNNITQYSHDNYINIFNFYKNKIILISIMSVSIISILSIFIITFIIYCNKSKKRLESNNLENNNPIDKINQFTYYNNNFILNNMTSEY